jgi:predicted O-methyltransferase YrrM
MLRNIAKRVFLAFPPSLQPLLLKFHPQYRWIGRMTRNKVVTGPFKGMKYIYRSVGSSLFPKLLGTYEMELWPQVKQAIERQPELVVDIGAAEGYYAIGLARSLPSSRVVCFEAQESLHFLLHEMASLNNVTERVTLHGFCTASLLNKTLTEAPSTLVVCDIEGAEDEVLDPANVPALLDADILVELHDAGTPGVSDRIRERFEATHTITKLTSRERTTADWPLRLKPSWKRQSAYLAEGRPIIMDWFWMMPKVRP